MTRYESTMKQWEELLAKAEKRLQRSILCYEKFRDEDSENWVKEDTAEVERIKRQIEDVKKRFNNI